MLTIKCEVRANEKGHLLTSMVNTFYKKGFVRYSKISLYKIIN